jgi:ubiquinone/menaquinone biosynthesis C-methylase UbiE
MSTGVSPISPRNPIVETYSRLAREYDEEANFLSCWGRASERALSAIRLRQDYQVVVDMGCGTGRAIHALASAAPPHTQFIGIDPAENMCRIAAQKAADQKAVQIRQGAFEKIPLETASVDYLYSILAFHWVTDLAASVAEIARVLRPNGEMELFFIGRDNGREFIQKTSAIFLKYMGPALLLDSARLRKQLTREAASQLFSKVFESSRLSVDESFTTYYDTLEGHWSWWVRVEGHFVKIPPEKKAQCDSEVRQALQSLAEPRGIPYTIHELHVKLHRPSLLH